MSGWPKASSGSAAGVGEITDGTNVATGNVKLAGAGLVSVVVTPGANGTATITGLEPSQVFYVPPTGDSSYVADTAAIRAIQTAQGSNPYLILLGANSYYIAQGGLVTFGRNQGITGQGLALTTIVWQGGGSGNTCIKANDASFSSSASIAGPFGGFSIACQNNGTGIVGFQFGNLLHARNKDMFIYGVGGSGSIAFYGKNSGGGYSEEGEWTGLWAISCQTGFVFDTSSFDYNIFELGVVAAANTNGVLLQNAAQLSGTRFELRGNFNGGSGSNSGIVLGIDANGGGSGTSQLQGNWDVIVEADGTGVGHQAYNFGGGAASQSQGVGQFRFVNAGINFAAGAAGYETFAFTGQMSVPAGSTLGAGSGGVVGQGVGSVTVGATLTIDQGFNVALNPLELGSGDIGILLPAAGANTFTFTQVPAFSQEIEMLIVQPASGAAATITWPAGVFFSGNSVLSTAHSAVDRVKLRYFPSVTGWYGTISQNFTAGAGLPAPGATLGYVNYVSGSVSYSITTTTPGTAIDGTNLELTNIVGPASGAVEVSVDLFFISGAINTGGVSLSLVTHGSTTQVCNLKALGGGITSAGEQNRPNVIFIVTGLTPGTAYNWDLAAWLTGSGDSCTIYAGTGQGPVTMVARAI